MATAGPLELPAMILTPLDLADAGQPGFGALEAQAVGPEELAGTAGDLTDQIVNDEIQATLQGMGLLEGYQFGMRLLQDPTGASRDVARDIYGSLHEFNTEAGATEAMSFISSLTIAEPELVRVEGSGALGPNAIYLRQTYGEGEDISYLLGALFQTGPVITYLYISDLEGPEPLIEELDTVGILQQQSVLEALQSGTLGLGNKVPRLIDAEFLSYYEIRRDSYMRRDGVEIPQSFDDPAQAATRAQLAGNATDVYALTQFVDEAWEIDPSFAEQFGVITTVYRFSDDSEATAWLSDRPNWIETEYAGTDYAVQDIQVLADTPTFGDESITLKYTEVGEFGGPINRIFIRVANTVADVRFSPLGEMPLAALESLAAMQAECLVNTCIEPVLIGEALLGQTTAGAPVAETPVAGLTPEPSVTPSTGVSTGPPSGGLAVQDLAAMTLTPGDLDDLAAPGFGSSYGEMITLETLIASTSASRGIPEADVRLAFEGNGLTRRYEHFLYQPVDPAAPADEAGKLIVSYVVEFADPAGASAAWDFSEDESFSPESADLPMLQTIGEQSEATHGGGVDDSGSPFDQIDVTFRTGNLHAGVAMVDWTGGSVDLSEVESLAGRLLERIEAVRSGNSPGLSGQVVRLMGDDVTPSADEYYLLGGKTVRAYGQSPWSAVFEDYFALLEQRTDGYRLNQQLTAGTEDTNDDTWLLIDSALFASEAEASEGIVSTPQTIASNPDLGNVQFVEGSGYGDESISYTASSTDGAFQYRGVVLRVGTVVVTIDLVAGVLPTEAALDTIVQNQLTCIEQGGCVAPIEVPTGI